MPPVHVEVKATLCPSSMVAVVGEMLGVPKAELTLTLSVEDKALVGVVALSVAL